MDTEEYVVAKRLFEYKFGKIQTMLDAFKLYAMIGNPEFVKEVEWLMKNPAMENFI